jgi:hypothetical protein
LIHVFGYTKVTNFAGVIMAQKNIGSFDISVNNISKVK